MAIAEGTRPGNEGPPDDRDLVMDHPQETMTSKSSCTIEDAIKFTTAVRDCNLNGHSWEFTGKLGGQCTSIKFICAECGARKHKWFHNQDHETLTKMLRIGG